MKISDISYIIRRLKLVKKISKLNIENAGIEEDMGFVKLVDGPVFYGRVSREKDRKYYKLLPKSIKSALPFESFVVANDIIIRYIEGGLKLGGPAKELYYKTQKGDIVAEMGAYMGFYTLYLSNKVGNTGKIIAIEPMPDNLKYLRKNIEANKIANVVIIPKGVWKQKDSLTFEQRKGDHQSGSIEINYSNNDQFSIPVDSLDNILLKCKVDHVNFMLIQLNGVEPEALEGLTKIKPENFAFAARYSVNKENAAQGIARTLEERGYLYHIVDRDFVFADLKK